MRFRLALILPLLLCACTVKTSNDYDQYLRNNQNMVEYARVPVAMCYDMTERTRNHHKDIKTWMGGILNTWTVNFGPILDATMRSQDVQSAFTSLRPAAEGNCAWTITYDLTNYDFSDTRAKVGLTVTTTDPDGKSESKGYYAEGKEQTGKMFWGSTFAMKNAVQQSTKQAIDTVLLRQFEDLSAVAAQQKEKK